MWRPDHSTVFFDALEARSLQAIPLLLGDEAHLVAAHEQVADVAETALAHFSFGYSTRLCHARAPLAK